MRSISYCIALACCFFIGTSPLQAQDLEKDMFKPFGENADECYGKSLMPSVYDTIYDRMEVRPAYTYVRRVAPVFDTIYEEVLVRPAYTKFEVIEPVFEVVTERIKIQDKDSYLKAFNPISDQSFTDKLEVQPERKVWRKTKRKKNCRSNDPEKCLEWHVVTLPAEYVEVERKIINSPKGNVSDRIIEVDEQYVTIQRQILKKEGGVREVDVLPEYKKVMRLVTKQKARFEEVNVPAEYQVLTRTRLSKMGGNVEPVRVLCPKNYKNHLATVQQKLTDLGYEIGPIDGVMGRKTKAALVEYQAKYQLPIGQLDFQTLEHLGILLD